jgi:uncharacterized RDD family membrane protein YckC
MNLAGPPDPRYRVETPERVDLAYDVAGLGSRALAGLIDTIIQIGVLLGVAIVGCAGLAIVLGGLGEAFGDGESGLLTALAVIVVLNFIVLWGYYIFFELVWHGQTPGKRQVGLRVVKEGGYPIGFSESAIRNVVRLVDFLPYFYGVGGLVMFIDRRGRRLGDFAAGTVVVKERKDVTLESLGPVRVPAPAAGWPAAPATPHLAESAVFPNLARLTADDESVLREYLLRRPTLDRAVADALAARLAQTLARKLEYDPAGEHPAVFLQRLASELSRR